MLHVADAHFLIWYITDDPKLSITAKKVFSKKFLLEYNCEFYLPKYVISVANKYANGKELDLQEFSGGTETNNFLKNLGLHIVKSLQITLSSSYQKIRAK